MKLDIDDSIKHAKSYEDFILIMQSKGYTITGEKFGDDQPKYIKFEKKGIGRATRGSEKNFGKGYTKEQIKNRIENASNNLNTSKGIKNLFKNKGTNDLINLTEDKYKNSFGLQRWASIENLKIAAAAYSETNSIKELEKEISSKKEQLKVARASLVSIENEMKDVALIIRYAEQYQSNKPYNFRYKKSKDPEGYFRRHDTELSLYDGACNMLHNFHLNPEEIDIEKLKKRYEKLNKEKEELNINYQKLNKENEILNKKYDNIDSYIKEPMDKNIYQKYFL